MQKVQVALLGLNTLFGRVSSYLLKQSNAVNRLCLYDEYNIDPARDIAIINTSCKVEAFLGKEELNHAVKDADIVIIGDENLSTPYTAFDLMAPKICDYAKAIATSSPNAIIVVAASPVNILVPLLSEALIECGCYDCNKIVGATAVDNSRASCVLANYMKANPQKIVLPVIGGSSKETRVPLLSKANPSPSLTKDAWNDLVSRIKESDSTIFCFKKMPEALNKAYSTVKFLNLIFAGLRGEPNRISIAFSRTSQVPNVDYFALPVQFGRFGIQQRYGLPKVLSFESDLINEAVFHLKKDTDLAKQFIKGKESAIESCGRNVSREQMKQTIYGKSGKQINSTDIDPFPKEKDDEVVEFQKSALLNSKLRKSLTSSPPKIMVKPWDKPFDIKSFCIKNVKKYNDKENTKILPELNPKEVFNFGKKCIKQIQSSIDHMDRFPSFLTSLENPTDPVPTYTTGGSLLHCILSKFTENNSNFERDEINSHLKLSKQIFPENKINCHDSFPHDHNIGKNTSTEIKLCADNCIFGKEKSINVEHTDKLPRVIENQPNESDVINDNAKQTVCSSKQPYSSKDVFYFTKDRINMKKVTLSKVCESIAKGTEREVNFNDNSTATHNCKEDKTASLVSSPTYALVHKNKLEGSQGPVTSSEEDRCVHGQLPCKIFQNNVAAEENNESITEEPEYIGNQYNAIFNKGSNKENYTDQNNQLKVSTDNLKSISCLFSSNETNNSHSTCINDNKKLKIIWEKMYSSRKLSSYNRLLSDKLITQGSSFLKSHNTILERKTLPKNDDPFQNIMEALSQDVYSDGIVNDYLLSSGDHKTVPTHRNDTAEVVNNTKLDEDYIQSQEVNESISISKNPTISEKKQEESSCIFNSNEKSDLDVHGFNNLPVYASTEDKTLHHELPEHQSTNTENQWKFQFRKSKNYLKENRHTSSIQDLKANIQTVPYHHNIHYEKVSDAGYREGMKCKAVTDVNHLNKSSITCYNNSLLDPVNLSNNKCKSKNNPLKISETVHCICKKIPNSTMQSNYLKLKIKKLKSCVSCHQIKKTVKTISTSPKSIPKKKNGTKQLLTSSDITKPPNHTRTIQQKHNDTKNGDHILSNCVSIPNNINAALNLRDHASLKCRSHQLCNLSANSKKVENKCVLNCKNKMKLPVKKQLSKNLQLIMNYDISKSARKEKSRNTNRNKLDKKCMEKRTSCTDNIELKKTKDSKNLLKVIQEQYEGKMLTGPKFSNKSSKYENPASANLTRAVVQKNSCCPCTKQSNKFPLRGALIRKNYFYVTEKVNLNTRKCSSVSQSTRKNSQFVPKCQMKLIPSLPAQSSESNKLSNRKYFDSAYLGASATSYMLRDKSLKLKNPISELCYSSLHDISSLPIQSRVNEDFIKSRNIRNLCSEFTNTCPHDDKSIGPKLPTLAFLRSQTWSA